MSSEMALETPIESDCAPLQDLIARILAAVPATRFLRDPTRGGVATVLNEIAAAAQLTIEIDEAATPLRDEVRGLREILGLDPHYLANEGKIVGIVPPEQAERALDAMRAHPARPRGGYHRPRDGWRAWACHHAHGFRRPAYR